MKDSCIFHTKISEKNRHCFTFMRLSLVSGLIEDSWVLIFDSAFNMFRFFVLVEVRKKIAVMEKIQLHTDT